MENDIEVWDWTKLSAYLTCDTKGKLGFEDHLVPSEPSEALAFGIGIHKMVEVWTHEVLFNKVEIEAGLAPTHEPLKAAEAAFLSIWEKPPDCLL